MSAPSNDPDQQLPTAADADIDADSSATDAAKDNASDGTEIINQTLPLVVGVGASAGGLEAFRELIAAFPPEPGLILIFVQHLDPRHDSLLSELLSRSTQMPVVEIKDVVELQANHIYVAPPSANVVVFNGKLSLQPIEITAERHKTIDFFFRSLANDQAENAVAVLLSGTASDGVLGLRSIKEKGGITLVQDEKTARFQGLPRLAAEAGMADYVLTPTAIGLELLRIANTYPTVRRNRPEIAFKPDEREILHKILALVWTLSNVDFSCYKPTTVRRRILRRIVLTRLSGLSEYLQFLEKNPAEVQALYQDLVINVTHFFREPEVFDALRNDVLPKILQDKPLEAPIRIWVPGCSTGEEVYSFAITLLEVLGERASNPTIQIFGTDISDNAIERARAAIYPDNITETVSPERLQRFFLKRDGGYQIAKPVRDLCIFARQNVFKDPPFSNLDIISCRNVLIYFGPELQKRVFPMFHYALNPNGYLILGSSESIGSYADYFSLAHNRYKIYTKKSVAPQLMFEFSRADIGAERLRLQQPLVEELHALEPQREADRMVLDKYGPPSVLINSDMNILQFRGRTGLFLEPAPGTASFNLLRMAREGLMVALHTATHEAFTEHTSVTKKDVRFKSNGGFYRVDLHVMPLPASGGSREKFLLVLFENGRSEDDSYRPEPSMNDNNEQTAPAAQEDMHLRQELIATKEYLQSVIESQEAFNEELRSANEEILSANEELQSTNEELETAKEELQSANEELTTLNEELQTRNGELAKVNDDLSNLLNSVNLAIIMLDSNLRVRRFTPLAEKLMNLIPSDIGRPFSDINPSIVAPGLLEIVRDVIDTLAMREMEVQDREGHWYNLRVRPYRTVENRIEGALLALVDIQSAKQTAANARKAAEYFSLYADTIHEPVLLLTEDLHIQEANRAFCERYRLSLPQLQHRRLNELGDNQLNSQTLGRLLQRLQQEQSLNDFVLEGDSQQTHALVVNARIIPLGDNQSPMTLLAITEREVKAPE